MRLNAVLLALAAGAGIRLRRQSPSTLGTGNPAVADAAAGVAVAPAAPAGPPDLPASIEVATSDRRFITLALDNWNVTKADLVAQISALVGVNGSRVDITAEMDQEVVEMPNQTAMDFPPAPAPAAPAGAPAVPYVAETPEQAAARLEAAQERVTRDVPPPLIYFFNVSIAADPKRFCPHDAGPGLLKDASDPSLCDCVTLVRADDAAARLLDALKMGKVATFDLDGRPTGAWSGHQRFMKPLGQPRPEGQLSHWEGGAPVTPKEAMALSGQTNALVSDFVAEQARYADAAAKALQMPGHFPCRGSMAMGAVRAADGQYPVYPCVEKNQQTPEVPTNAYGPAVFGPPPYYQGQREPAQPQTRSQWQNAR